MIQIAAGTYVTLPHVPLVNPAEQGVHMSLLTPRSQIGISPLRREGTLKIQLSTLTCDPDMCSVSPAT
jgi:hypothetical protein